MNKVALKQRLQDELAKLRQRVTSLEAGERKRKQTEEALRQSEEYSSTILNRSPNPILVANSDTSIRYVNPAFEVLTGFSLIELIGQKAPYPWWPEETLEKIEGDFEESLRHSMKAIERLFRKKNGEQFWAEITATPVEIDGEFNYYLENWVDITERKRAEEALQLRAHLLNEANDSIIATDLDGNLIYMNEATCRTRGYSKEEMLNMNLKQLVPPKTASKIDERLRQVKEDGATVYESEHTHQDGSVFPVEVTARIVEMGDRKLILYVIRDTTERKKMEAQLIVTDRLASIGELASGVAHELNNPLTGILGFSELLLNKDVPEDVREDLKIINREAQRTSQVVKNLLTFARKHDTTKKPVDINKAIKSVLDLRAYEQKVHNIEVVTKFDPGLPAITADLFRLQQVFVNIIINAEYFMIQAHGRGMLTITTERKGDIIQTSFANDGPGIEKEHLRHLFDPFFTTKEVGRGTGLGLSICHGIVIEHGGQIYAESESGMGATFTVELPIK
jgi:PAS domain S-box-containing protein